MTITFKNYATLTFTDKPEADPLVVINFHICDDGYAGYCIERSNALVAVHLPSHPKFHIIASVLSGIGSIGGRGSNPDGEFHHEIRKGFIQTIGSWLVRTMTHHLATEDNPKIFAKLEIRGNYPHVEEWKLEKDYKIIEAA